MYIPQLWVLKPIQEVRYHVLIPTFEFCWLVMWNKHLARGEGVLSRLIVVIVFDQLLFMVHVRLSKVCTFALVPMHVFIPCIGYIYTMKNIFQSDNFLII